MKRRIEQVLQQLTGKVLWGPARAADMQTFQIGAKRAVPARSGGTKTVGEFALHIQCSWRIAGQSGIIVARRDLYYPRGYPEEGVEDLPNFDWDHEPNRRDERIIRFFAEDHNPVIESVAADALGGIRLMLSGGFVLAAWPDISLPDVEHWRLFRPGDVNDHFVVTGQGIEQ